MKGDAHGASVLRGQHRRRGGGRIEGTAFPACWPAARDATAGAPATRTPAAASTTAQQQDNQSAHRTNTSKRHEDSPLFLSRQIRPVGTPACRESQRRRLAAATDFFESMRGCRGESTK